MAAKLERGEKELDRVLSFFSRVEAKAATLFAFDSGLLALMALNLHATDVAIWYISLPGSAALVMLFASLWFVYRANFPDLEGGSASVIYFVEIAKRTEAKYLDEYLSMSDDDYHRDIVGQVWRNSQILKIKYESVRCAFVVSGLSLVPWFAFLAGTSVTYSRVPVIK